MTATLVATPGAADANAYADLAEADAYFDSVLYADDWTGADTDTKTRALIYATLLLDSKYEWAGNVSRSIDQGQRLQWPRQGVIDADGISTVDEDVIPRQLKEATAEFAKQLIVANTAANSDVETQGITSITAGPISLAFSDDVKLKTVPDAVRMMLPAWWGKVRGSVLTATALRS